jgi:hypothetical protein
MQKPKLQGATQNLGFSIVEVTVSAAILTIATISVIGIFNSITYSLRQGSITDDIAAAISADAAEIESLNRNFTCKTGVCELAVEQAPTKFDYAPDSSNIDGTSLFKDICISTDPANNLLTNLLTQINQVSAITASNGLASVSIKRSARLHPDNFKPESDTGKIYPKHLYIVEWSPPAGAGSKRMLVLSPTVANWCP